MTFEKFNKAIDVIKKSDEFVNTLNKVHLEIFETPIADALYYFQKEYFTEVYGSEGYDWISWFLYEKMEAKNPEEFKAWDSDGNEILRNLEELYHYLEENYKKNLDNIKK